MNKNKKIFRALCFMFSVMMIFSISASASGGISFKNEDGHLVPFYNDEISVASPDGLVAGDAIYDKTGNTVVGFEIPISDEESRVAVPRKGISGDLIGYELTISDKESLLIVPRKGCGINEHVEITFSNGKELSITSHYDKYANLIPLTIPLVSDEGLYYSAEEIYTALSELAGCGKVIQLVGTTDQGLYCGNYPAGNPTCLSRVYIELYSCNPSCHPGAYCGYVYRCNSGHAVDQGGKIYGVCS